MDKNKQHDLDTLSEIIDGLGLGAVLAEGSSNIYYFHDREIAKSFQKINKNVRIIKSKYEELMGENSNVQNNN